jgi:hypothetical protein
VKLYRRVCEECGRGSGGHATRRAADRAFAGHACASDLADRYANIKALTDPRSRRRSAALTVAGWAVRQSAPEQALRELLAALGLDQADTPGSGAP